MGSARLTIVVKGEKMKTFMPEELTIESICRVYELNLITEKEARALVRQVWGIDSQKSEEK